MPYGSGDGGGAGGGFRQRVKPELLGESMFKTEMEKKAKDLRKLLGCSKGLH